MRGPLIEEEDLLVDPDLTDHTITEVALVAEDSAAVVEVIIMVVTTTATPIAPMIKLHINLTSVRTIITTHRPKIPSTKMALVATAVVVPPPPPSLMPRPCQMVIIRATETTKVRLN